MSGDSLATVLDAGLGRTICRDFYFPYARKVWGLDPAELSATQARRRVSASTLSKMVRRVLAAVPGLKPGGSGRFYYPRYGYGQISETLERAARDAGADILLGAEVQSVGLSTGPAHAVRVKHGDNTLTLRADQVWSTLPITALARCIAPAPPPELLRAAHNLDFRAMILVYVVLQQPRFTEYDAHYFPETEIAFSRLSEPKNYSGGQGPANTTVLCAELPCSAEDRTWSMSDAELGNMVCEALHIAGVPVRAPVRSVVTRRLRQAYPIYRKGYEAHFQALDTWLGKRSGLLTFGRQGLFAHDNTHHALYMAYCAVACLDRQGGFDKRKWETFRSVFESHVVED
jgi:protoporphyrinogen oxidase